MFASQSGTPTHPGAKVLIGTGSDKWRLSYLDLSWLRGHFAAAITCVEGVSRLDEEDVSLLVGLRAVLNATGHHEQLPRLEFDITVSQMDGQPTTDHEEEVVGLLVPVPDEASLDLDDLDLVVVDVPDDSWLVGLVEECELSREVDLVIHGLRFSFGCELLLDLVVWACIVEPTGNLRDHQPVIEGRYSDAAGDVEGAQGLESPWSVGWWGDAAPLEDTKRLDAVTLPARESAYHRKVAVSSSRRIDECIGGQSVGSTGKSGVATPMLRARSSQCTTSSTTRVAR